MPIRFLDEEPQGSPKRKIRFIDEPQIEDMPNQAQSKGIIPLEAGREALNDVAMMSISGGVPGVNAVSKVLTKVPIVGPYAQKARDLAGQFAAGVGKGASFGLTEKIADKTMPGVMEPKNKEEALAQGVGEFAGFFTGPGAVYTGVEKAVAKGLGKVGATTLGKMASGAAAGATVGALDTPEEFGDLNKRGKQAAVSAALSAFFPFAGKAIKTVANFEIGERLINSMVKPKAGELAYGKNPGRAVAKLKITANSWEEFAQKIEDAVQQQGDKINKILSSKKINFKKVDLTDVLKPIDDEISRLYLESPRTNAGVLKRLNDVKLDLLRANEIPTSEGTQIVAGRAFGQMSPAEATEIKREIGKLTRWTGNASDDKSVNMALKKVYGSIKEKINEAVPGLSGQNELLADLISASNAVKYRAAQVAKNNMVSLTGANVGGIGALIGSMASRGSIPHTAAAGLAVATIFEAFKRPSVRTRVASWLSSSNIETIGKSLQDNPNLKKALLATFKAGGLGSKLARAALYAEE